MMYHYYYKAVQHDSDLRGYLRNRIHAYYVERRFSSRGDPLNARMAKEFSDPGEPPRAVTITSFDVSERKDLSETIALRETPLTTAYISLHGSFKKILSSAWWSVGQLMVLFAALGVLAFRRLTHDGAFLLVILALSVLGSASIVSLVEYSQSRYSYPLEWTYYVTAIGVVLRCKSEPARRR